ncbi:class 1 isoprenoid biosynthesis enzyme [Nonomuraea sp. SBT364]|uniref:class 1 isoprenoid biosynthesis enzyme n=1 Tax=Nonomuraea sp. SBT364 TaxID=1580530 RepID=UPI00066B373C|nr:class 1 isoprenoid biosynthesis enzyme [Nonomuraea sp. SBT364]
MTVNFVVANYARMAGLPFDAELSVLGGAFARLYDDMIDNIDDAAMDERLAGLFRGDGIEPATDSEQLLSRLHAAIDERLARPADAPIHGMLLALHEHQLASRGQRDPGISRDDLGKITRGKGGLANVTLLALVQPRMSTEERELIMELGEAFQLLDDYLDQDEDRRDGIFTPITRGEATLADVGARMRALRPKLAAHYGAGPVRPFLSMLFLMMGAICVKRHWLPDRVRRRPTRARKPKAAIWSLVGDAEAATPRRP